MKKILILMFLLQSLILFSQDLQKQNVFIFSLGIHNNHQLKKEFHPAYTPLDFPWQDHMETLYPGYFTYPEYGINTNLGFKRKIWKGLSLGAAISYSNRKYEKSRSIDSVHHYYLYPDSIINILSSLTPHYTRPYIYLKSIDYNIYFDFRVGWQYKRFDISFLTGLHIVNFHISKVKYIYDTKKYTSTSFIGQDRNEMIYQMLFKYRLINKKHPLWACLIWGDVVTLGLEIEL